MRNRLARGDTVNLEPELDEELTNVWDLFYYLCGKRQVGMSACPIMASEIEVALDVYGVTDAGARWDYRLMLSAMDAKWLSLMTAKKETPDADSLGSH